MPDYAKEAVGVLSSAGIVNGMGDNLFAPLQYATRAQSAKIVYGVIQAVIG
ncbi:MAG: S-layer homology domain-containing protein [Clostridia bacterium]|nr:S-layer homology domain-containing protein [Clostridia bacterium]